MRWCAVTAGEDLFFFLSQLAIPSLPSSQLTTIGGNPGFHSYIRGAIAIHAMRRLIRHSTEVTQQATETTHVRLISSFASEEVFPSLGKELIARLARLVLLATRATRQNYTNATADDVMEDFEEVRCYLCTQILDRDNKDEHHAEFFRARE